ncbi:MAG: 30S ribosomal protein S18 [Candidatus Wildermuthbacteria bacterium RIFCSPLOWO2_02_FULL_47_9c]|uniref:30S ribosomal protein S18 n=2 Tax=Candidatus Wildermuthiibacteriota TaxID=1817923 RepID=A0A1G2RT53_9BACT|nr:MAG: 30S ribosomal protein S18 [Candidatus Wildermuthbacteria bacterium RIFCSPLOWO2_01_FULL_48_29]OHA76024.1 MAG: 30S ribosomal protein S18 [Candidatus Wildermuthbacteria bacterium RIFCSPLOWO2_02_FULL_47_9c]
MECYFCKKNIQDIDFRDTILLRRFLSGLGKIRKRAKTGLCATHQRQISRSVKRARHVGLLSATRK